MKKNIAFANLKTITNQLGLNIKWKPVKTKDNWFYTRASLDSFDIQGTFAERKDKVYYCFFGTVSFRKSYTTPEFLEKNETLIDSGFFPSQKEALLDFINKLFGLSCLFTNITKEENDDSSARKS